MIAQSEAKASVPEQKIDTMDKILKTERLLLRPVLLDDIDHIIAGLSDFDVAQMMEGASLPFLRQDALDLFNGLPHLGIGGWNFAVTLPARQVVGLVCLRQHNDRWLLQYWLNRSHWGHGYMREALFPVLERFFATLPEATVSGDVYADDVRALNLQRAIGFKITGSREIFASIRSAMVVKISMQLKRNWFEPRELRVQ